MELKGGDTLDILNVKVNGEWVGIPAIEGEKGDPGDDYVLTQQDKEDIAELVGAPVTDVQVNGTSVLDAQGVAEIPLATNYNTGVVRVSAGSDGIAIAQNGGIYISRASDTHLKAGTDNFKPIVASNQHVSTFYGLAKAAGDTAQSASSNTVGNYTDEAKAAIQQMLGVPSTDDIPEVPVTDVQIDGTSILDAQGVANVPTASGSALGVVKYNADYGILVVTTGTNKGQMRTTQPTDDQIKAGTVVYRTITPTNQHKSTFYGLAKAAGADMASSSNAVGTYTDEAKIAIQKMLGVSQQGELIADVTSTEDLETFTVNTDISGQPFTLRSAKIYAVISASLTDTNDYITARFGSVRLNGTATVLTLPTMRMVSKNGSLNTYEIEAYGAYYLNRAYTASGFSSSSGAMSSMSILAEVAGITEFLIKQYSATTTLIPAGTRILIYGIRA